MRCIAITSCHCTIPCRSTVPCMMQVARTGAANPCSTLAEAVAQAGFEGWHTNAGGNNVRSAMWCCATRRCLKHRRAVSGAYLQRLTQVACMCAHITYMCTSSSLNSSTTQSLPCAVDAGATSQEMSPQCCAVRGAGHDRDQLLRYRSPSARGRQEDLRGGLQVQVRSCFCNFHRAKHWTGIA